MPPKKKELKHLRCFECKRIFCCIECRKKHELKTHLTNPKCPLCEGKPFLLLREFQEIGWLISHIEHVHLPLQCKRCNKVFYNLNDLAGRNTCRTLGHNFMSPLINMNLPTYKGTGNSSLRNQTPDFGGSLQSNFLKRSISGNFSCDRNTRSTLNTRLLTTSTPMTHNVDKNYFSPMGSQVSDINSPDSEVDSPVYKFQNPLVFTPSYEENNKITEIKSIPLIKGIHRKAAMKIKSSKPILLQLPSPSNQSDEKLADSNISKSQHTSSKPKVHFAMTPSIINDNEEIVGSKSGKFNFTPRNPSKNSARFELLRQQFESNCSRNFGSMPELIDNNNTENISPIINYNYKDNKQNAESFGEKYLAIHCLKDNTDKMATPLLRVTTYEEQSEYVEELYVTASYYNKTASEVWHSPHSSTQSLLKDIDYSNLERTQSTDEPAPINTGFIETNGTNIIRSQSDIIDDRNSAGIWSSVAHAMRSAFRGFQGSKQTDTEEKSPNKNSGISKHASQVANILLRRSSTGKRRRSASFHTFDQSPVSKRIRGEKFRPIRGRLPIARMRKLDVSLDPESK